MLPNICFSFEKLLPRRKKECDQRIVAGSNGRDRMRCQSLRNYGKTATTTMVAARFPLRSEIRDRNGNEEIGRKREMANKVTHISDLIHRVASSCLTHHPAAAASHHHSDDSTVDRIEEEENEARIWEEENDPGASVKRVMEMESAMAEVFDAVSAVKRAYVSLQDSHSPWDPDRMRTADAAVVAELRRLGRLRDWFRRSGGGAPPPPPVREAVAPYEAALGDLKRELKAKEEEVESLKERLRRSTTPRGSGKKARIQYSKRVGCISGLAVAAPTQELFEACMEEVRSASKVFTARLLSLMRAARWDIAASVRSIVDGDDVTVPGAISSAVAVDPHHAAKHAVESYVSRCVFRGFEHETFYIDGSLGSLLRPAEFRRDCFAQFRDMRGMDPAEMLGVLPTCQFGRFAGKKYLALVHRRMEESLFGGVEQRRLVADGGHPRTGFYGEFLTLAKAVWLLHLLAFALDPAPTHFEAGRGAEFQPEYMESVMRYNGGRMTVGSTVGFSVSPGFKLGSGSVVRARVYLVSRGLGE